MFCLLARSSREDRVQVTQRPAADRTQQANSCEDSHTAGDMHVYHAHMSIRKTKYTCSASTEHDNSCIGLHVVMKTITCWPWGH